MIPSSSLQPSVSPAACCSAAIWFDALLHQVETKSDDLASEALDDGPPEHSLTFILHWWYIDWYWLVRMRGVWVDSLQKVVLMPSDIKIDAIYINLRIFPHGRCRQLRLQIQCGMAASKKTSTVEQPHGFLREAVALWVVLSWHLFP